MGRRAKQLVRRAKVSGSRHVAMDTEGIPSLEDLVAQITPENRHPELDWGPPVGREKEFWSVTTPRVRRPRSPE
jgi:hypothetical protein